MDQIYTHNTNKNRYERLQWVAQFQQLIPSLTFLVDFALASPQETVGYAHNIETPAELEHGTRCVSDLKATSSSGTFQKLHALYWSRPENG